MNLWLLATALLVVFGGAGAAVIWVVVERLSVLLREEREAHERQLDDLHDRLSAKNVPEYLTLRQKDEPRPGKPRTRSDAEEAAIEKRRKSSS